MWATGYVRRPRLLRTASLALILDKQLRELLLQRLGLGQVAYLDVRVVFMMERVVLVIVFGAIKALQRSDLCNDRLGERLGRIELRDVRGGNSLLLVIGIEDGRAV